MLEVIEWNEHSLLEMITRRIKHSYPDLSHKEDIYVWNCVLAETLDYRQTKSFNYVVDRTLYRPREIIQFCTDIKEKALESPISDVPVNYKVISEAELIYSQSRTKDIAAEYRHQYPGLLSIFEAFRGREYSFDRNELELFCLEICLGDISTDPDASWVKNQDSDYLIEILWQVGFFRAQAVGGLKARRRSGSSYLGPHQIDVLNLRNLNRFHVHPMFRAYLGLKEPKKS